jgi:hypothetical protein
MRETDAKSSIAYNGLTVGCVTHDAPVARAAPEATAATTVEFVSPCAALVAAGMTDAADQVLPQTFNPGVAVPAGDAVRGFSLDDQGSAEMYGYLVPASAMPATAAPSSTRLRHQNGSPTIGH